jgi:hypothetical protein
VIVSGEAIRLMNYIDDISATLRRIQSGLPTITEEERRRVIEYMRNAQPNWSSMVEMVEKGK